MRISNSVPKYNSSLSFQRSLREDEKPAYEKTMNEAFDYLGLDTRALIVHGSSFPSQTKGKHHSPYIIPAHQNPFVGSPYFAKEFTDFAKMNGFNAIQLGPNGKLNKNDNSPYHASIFAKNELFLNYDKCKTPEYASLLSDEDLNDIQVMTPKHYKNYEMSDFDEANAISSIITKRIYNNFTSKLQNNEPNAQKLNKEFITFKKENNHWLEKDSIFRILSDIHGGDDFENWDNTLDKNLVLKVKQGNKQALLRYEQIKNNPVYKEKMNEYQFTQFLLDKQEKEDKAQRQKDGMNYIGDLLVGYSYSDEWANPDAFLSGWRVGAPNGGKNNGPQLWNIPVLNPQKLFNKDGSLGPAGELLKTKIEKAVSGVENLRVDNVMGLVDPYVYRTSSVHNDTLAAGGGDFLSNRKDLDPNHDYSKILHNILYPTLKEHNINPKNVVWENLGWQTQLFSEVFYAGKTDGVTYEDEKQSGIAYSKGVQMEKVKGPVYSFMGTHDDVPSVDLLKETWIYSNEGWNPLYLAGYLIPSYDEESAKESAEFCKKIDYNPEERLKAKYAELFRGTPNIEIMFSDFFGIDKIYNRGGKQDANNWKLKLNSDYQQTYYKDLENPKTVAMNMPELLGMAVKSKSNMDIATHKKSKADVDNEVGELKTRLLHWENILKQPEV